MVSSDPHLVPAPSTGSEGATSRLRSFSWAGAVAFTAGLWLFLRYLARVAAADAKVLAWLTPPVELLASTGGLISGVMGRHPWGVVSAVSLGTVAVLFVVVKRRRAAWKRQLLATFFFSTAGLTLAFLAMQHLVLAVFSAAVAGVTLLAHGTEASSDWGPPRRALVLVPLALGLALRLADLSERPPGYAEHAAVHHAQLSIPLFQELHVGVLHANRAALHQIWTTVVTDQHGPDSFVEALGFCAFGVNMTASRLTSALLGTLTILLAYGVGARLAGARAGLIFAFLLAVVPWHIAISRYEDTEHVLSPLQALATLYFLLGTIRRGWWRDFLGLGVTLGLSWYLYSPNQTLPLIVAVVVLITLLTERRFLVGKTVRALLAAACLLAVSFPAVSDFVHRGRALPIRSSYEDDISASFLSPTRLSRMAKSELQQLFAQADDPWFSKPGGGLSLVAAALLLPGLAWCASRIGNRKDRPIAVLFLFGLPVAALPGVLAPDPSFRRLILFALITVMLSALVLDRVCGWLPPRGMPRRLAFVAALLLALGGAATSTYTYFNLTHAYETESHRYDHAMARFVTARLGSRYITIVAVHDWDVDDVNRYLALAAYNTLSGLARRGIAANTVYRAVKISELASVLASPATISGRGLLLADQFLARASFEGVDVRTLVARDLPGARASIWRASDGTELFTWWEFETHPGGTGD